MPALISQRLRRRGQVFFAGVLCLAALSSAGWAEDSFFTSIQEAKTLELIKGKSVTLESAEPIRRISIADPEVADVRLFSPRELYLTANKAGTTNLTVWKSDHSYIVYDLNVSHDIAWLKQELQRILPVESELGVTAAGESITLSGTVSSTQNLSRILALVESFAPESKVVNLVQVAGVHQVMLEVRVAEVDRSTARRLGVNMNYVNGGEFGLTTLGGLTEIVRPDIAEMLAGPAGLVVFPAVQSMFRFDKGGATWTGFVDLLKEEGLAKVLAEPTLIALSGETASFLAGGEYPIPIPQGLGSVAIEYKRFGVGLSFTPTVLSEDKISINVEPEVSELDFTTAIQFEGFIIPGLSTRRASTTVELANGQTFAIAGLLSESVRDTIDKYPLLGDIPVLGALFRSQSFQKNESELVIFATPHLVRPLDMKRQTLPTDFHTDSNDAEFYIFGALEGKAEEPPLNNGQLDGKFGHELPTIE